MDFYQRRQIAATVPLVLETPTEIIIEGVAHDKTTLNPTFLRKLDYYDYQAQCPIITNRFWLRHDTGWQNASWGQYNRPDADQSSVKRDGGQGMVKQVWQSQFEPDIFFILGQRCRNYHNKVDSRTNKSLLGNVSNGARNGEDNVYASGQCYYHEDASYLYFLEQSNLYPVGGWTAETTYLMWEIWWSRINKSDLGGYTNTSYVDGGVVSQIVGKTETHLYITYNGRCVSNTTFGRHRLCAVNLVTGVQTELVTWDGGNYVHFPEPSFMRQATGKATFLKDYYVVNGNSTAWNHNRVEVNTAGVAATKEACVLDFTGGAFAAVDMKLLSQQNRQVALRCFTAIGVAKEYMGWAYCEKSTNNTEPIDRFNLYLFQIDNATNRKNLIAKQMIPFASRIRSLLPMNTNWTQFMVITDTFVAFMVLNEALDRFDEVTRIAGYFREIAIDDLDRIWMYTMEGKLSYTSAYVPTRVDVVLEKATYNYVGVPITSYVDVTAYDALSAKIAVQVNLVIDGPAQTVTFADTTKTKTVTTLTTGALRVPITINSNTSFRILANTGV